MNIHERKTKAFLNFVTEYQATSADAVMFGLGMKAMEKIYQDIQEESQQDLKNECELNGLEAQSSEC